MIDSRIRANIEAYVAAWNERDPIRRMKLLEQSCADDVLLRTPGTRVVGRSDLDSMIADFQRRRPDVRAVFSSTIDVQGSVFRYVGVVEGPAGVGGETFDAGECDGDGRIRVLLTFAGAAPPR